MFLHGEKGALKKKPTFIPEKSHYRRGGLMLWSRIGKVERIIGNVTSTVRSSTDKILRPYVVHVVAFSDFFFYP